MADSGRELTARGKEERLRDLNNGYYGLTRFCDDPWIQYAVDQIYSDYGDRVIVKPKQLRKFGHNPSIAADTKSTVARFQDNLANETFATGNTVDYIVSDNASDTGIVGVEGHAVDGSGNMSFVSQNATLNGTTPVALTTPMFRGNRITRPKGTFASPSTDLVGNIYLYDSAAATGVTAGVPDVAAATKVMIPAGYQQSEKCATSISYADYWVITKFEAGTSRDGPQDAIVDVDLEYREIGGVWRPVGLERRLISSAVAPPELLLPYVIIPKNCDVRMIATSTASATKVVGRVAGQLLSIVS